VVACRHFAGGAGCARPISATERVWGLVGVRFRPRDTDTDTDTDTDDDYDYDYNDYDYDYDYDFGPT
jgi:hypothetical protein